MRISDWSSDVCSSDLPTMKLTVSHGYSDCACAVPAVIPSANAAIAQVLVVCILHLPYFSYLVKIGIVPWRVMARIAMPCYRRRLGDETASAFAGRASAQ